MKTISQAITMTLGMGMFVMLLAPRASAGCGDLNTLQGPFVLAPEAPLATLLSRAPEAEKSQARGPSGPSIVGMWNFQFVSEGNTAHNPSIPDGAVLDFGYNQIHNDGTEIINSGGHAPATGNFCLGVWGQTGFLTYEINHFPLGYNATTGALVNLYNVREQADTFAQRRLIYRYIHPRRLRYERKPRRSHRRKRYSHTCHGGYESDGSTLVVFRRSSAGTLSF